ncbi:hypothetical protein TNCT_648341 [Trichonephila clavata]|uniref:Uncharacterized protein n=1 Tax=Trichonephila clavata TaxID=2740835 RepID=A0A8X6JTI5_TRICU|nr:hypothetical protein TNCT_648341 [Trichonephila clavata]
MAKKIAISPFIPSLPLRLNNASLPLKSPLRTLPTDSLNVSPTHPITKEAEERNKIVPCLRGVTKEAEEEERKGH